MKIAIAVHHFPPNHKGGGEWATFRMALALQKRGHQVRVVCVERTNWGPAKGVAWEDTVFAGLPVRRLSFNLAAVPDRFRFEFDNIWIGDHLYDFLADFQPDVFHLMSGYLISARALLVAHQRHIPTVLSLLDFWFLCPRILMLRSNGDVSSLPIRPMACAKCLSEEKRRYRLPGQVFPQLMTLFWRLQKRKIQQVEKRMIFLREALNNVDAVISPSEFLRVQFIASGFTSRGILFLRHGFDLRDVAPQRLPKRQHSPKLRVGYIGQIAWHKGVHVLFEAAKGLSQAPLSVRAYGDTQRFPEYTKMLRRQIANDPCLELSGPYEGPQQLSEILGELDVIVVPSLWSENSPLVILEAFAHGTPVIASDQGGMAELVHHERNGLLFVPGSAESLAQQLRRLLDDPDLLDRLRLGIGPVKSVEEEAEELEAIYRSLTGQHAEKMEHTA
jgi:glycosyltransferase involved in cell wall biosynthesis